MTEPSAYSEAVRVALPTAVRLQIVTTTPAPPEGDGWLHEIKHDGHRPIAIVPGRGQLKLLSRNGFDRTPLFRGPFRKLSAAGRTIALDGEIAVPDDRVVTHIDLLNDALAGRNPDRLTYFAFDLLYVDEHDLRLCPIRSARLYFGRYSTKSDASGSCMSITSLDAAGGCSSACARPSRNVWVACIAVVSRAIGSRQNAIRSASL